MIDKSKFKEKMAALLNRAEFTSLATYAREPLIDAVAGIAEECEVAEKTVVLKTAIPEEAETA
jgi:hypothetical protein